MGAELTRQTQKVQIQRHLAVESSLLAVLGLSAEDGIFGYTASCVLRYVCVCVCVCVCQRY